MLARVLETAGLATVSLSLVREHTEKINPPRALSVPFPYGMAVGHPGDAAQQRAVLERAFALLAADRAPILDDFPDDERDEAAAAIQASQVEAKPPAMDLATEVTAMRRYWEQWQEREHRSAVGVTRVNPQRFRGLVSFLEAFERGEPDADATDRPADIPKLEFVRLAVLDLRALYTEARLFTHPHETADERTRWLWGETALGAFIRRLGETMSRSDDPAVKDAVFAIVR